MTRGVPEPAPAQPLGRLLVLDDERELMAALRELLSAQGYETEGHTSAREALEALRVREFDLLLTDLMMPGIDGLEVLRAALEIDPQIVVVMMTGQGTVQTAVEAMKGGAFDYLLKPFRLAELLPVLERALAVRRLRQENVQLREAVAVHALCQTVASTLDRRTILDKLADAVLEQTRADELSVMLLAPEEDAFEIALVRGAGREQLLGRRVPRQAGVAGWVAAQREPLLLEGGVREARFAPLAPRAGIGAALSLPLLVGAKLVGVLNANITGPRRRFTPGQVKALSALGGAAAAGLEAARLYERVREEEERYRRVLENVDEIVYMVSLSPEDLSHGRGRVEFVSRRVEAIVGHAAEEFLADPALWQRLLHPEDAPEIERRTRELYAAGSGGTRLYRMRHKQSGEYRWLEDRVSVQRDTQGRVIGLFGVARDVTERKRAEEVLRDYAARLRMLSHRLLRVEEDERRKLARELHDRIGQNLTALTLHLKLVRGQLPANCLKRAKPRLDECETTLEQTAQLVRDVMADLRPPGLEELGLAAALREHTRQVADRGGFSAVLSETGALRRLPMETEIALFRIAQEALTNVAKHARASEVTLALEYGPETATLAIADNGRGFDPTAGSELPKASLGMIGMRERAEAIGATLRVESTPGRGTRVIVQTPRAV
jgi:PAS domain S-box-containing protein